MLAPLLKSTILASPNTSVIQSVLDFQGYYLVGSSSHFVPKIELPRVCIPVSVSFHCTCTCVLSLVLYNYGRGNLMAVVVNLVLLT